MRDGSVIKTLGSDFTPKRNGMEPGTILNACRSPREEREAETKRLGNRILRGGLGCGLVVEILLSVSLRPWVHPQLTPPSPGRDSEDRL